MSKKLIHTAADVYRRLAKEGLMLRGDKTGRDDTLWNELLSRLGFPEDTANLPKALEEKQITVETFIRAFFGCLEPFAAMMTDICAVMEQGGAKRAYHSMAIKYAFSDEDQAIDFSLSHFQKFWRTYRKLKENARCRIWSERDLDDFFGDLRGYSSEYADAIDYAAADHWQLGEAIPEAWRADGALWSTAKLLTSLNDMCDRMEALRRDGREENGIFSENSNHVASPYLAQLKRYMDEQTEFQPEPLHLGLLKEKLYMAYAHAGEIAWLRLNRLIPEEKADGLQEILQHYQTLPTIEQERERMIEDLQSILNLPVWRHRWQLYQVWVGLTVIRELRGCGLSVKLYVTDGTLELYEHHPSQLADISGCETPVSYWAELQTMLPASIGKSKSIRPDYRLARAPVSRPESTLLLVEAKQREKMDAKGLEELKARYRAGCPDGLVVFVNYDTFPEEADDGNIRLISTCRPGRPEAQDRLVGCIREIAGTLKAEYEEVERQRERLRLREEQNYLQALAQAESDAKEAGGLRGVYEEEALGAIVLDCRDPANTLFNRRLPFNNDALRCAVIQYLRANPLAQVRLAGLDAPPKLACRFDYNRDKENANPVTCDLDALLVELLRDVEGDILVMGYDSALAELRNRGRVILHRYTG